MRDIWCVRMLVVLGNWWLGIFSYSRRNILFYRVFHDMILQGDQKRLCFVICLWRIEKHQPTDQRTTRLLELLRAAKKWNKIKNHILYVKCPMACVMCYVSYVTCNLSPVTCHYRQQPQPQTLRLLSPPVRLSKSKIFCAIKMLWFKRNLC